MIYQEACNKNKCGTIKYIPRKMVTNNNNEYDQGNAILYKIVESSKVLEKHDLTWQVSVNICTYNENQLLKIEE